MAEPATDYLLRALDQLPLPLVLLRADERTGKLHVAYSSARSREFFGAPLRVGQTLVEAWPQLPAAAQGALQNAYRSGQPVTLPAPLSATETRAGLLRSFRAEPTWDPNGNVEGLLLTGAEEATDSVPLPLPPPATTAFQPVAPLPEAWPLITYCTSADGQQAYYLSPQWFHYTGQDAASPGATTAWTDAVHPEDLSRLPLSFGPARDTGQDWACELRLRRHDGEYRWFLCQAVPERDAAGQVVRWQGSSVEVHELHITHEQLRRREAQVRFMLQAIPQMVWTTNVHGGVTWMSEQWSRYTGMSMAQSAGAGWTAAMHPDDLRATYSYWTATVAAGTDADIHFRVREGSTGTYRWFLMRARAQHDEQGYSTGWFGTITDVHDLREARLQLEAKDQLLSQILSQAPACVATLTGPDHRYTFFNPAFETLMGQRLLVGRSVAEYLPEVVEQGAIDILDHVYQTGETLATPEARFVLTEPVGELYLDLTYQPLRDAKGQVDGILVFGIDVSKRVLARQEAEALQVQVAAADAHLRHLTEALPVITFTTDATGATLYISPQWYLYTGLPAGGPPADVDRVWNEVLHPDDRVAAATEIQASIQQGKLGRIELRLRGADGNYRWFLTEAVPELDEAGNLRQRHGYMLDIQEVHEIRAQLEDKDQLLTQILGQVPALIATVSGPDHRYTFINAAYNDLMGQRAVLGRPAAECLPDVAAQGFVDLADHVYNTGEPYVSQEALILLPNASGEPQQHYLNFTYQPLRDTQGHLTSLLAFGIDVTAQVQARHHNETLQAAFREQDERLRTMTEALPQITFIATQTVGIEYISPQWYAYTGQEPGTAVNEVWTSFVHPDDLPQVQKHLAHNRFRTTPWRYEFRLRRHDGEYRWHLSQGVPEPNTRPGALPMRWYGSDTDIHDVRELQEELRRGQARYRALTDKIPRQVWTANREGALDFFNERIAAYVGHNRDDLDPSRWMEVVHPEDRARVAALWRQAVTTAAPYTAEFRLRAHDGQYRWFRSEAAPEIDESGLVRRWYGTNTNIHDQRELEQTLRHSEEQFRFLAESVPQIVWTSQGGINGYINQRWFDYTGLDPVETGNQANWRAVIHPDDLALANERWAHAVATGDFFEVEYRFRRHDGVYRWFLGQGRAQRQADGRILQWFGTCTDIEDQKQTQQLLQAQNEELRQTNSYLDQFVYTASHDLRQPVNNMAGIFQELTRTAYFRDPDAVLLISMFEQALQQIDDTIKELTALVQVQRPYQQLPTEAVSLPLLAQEVLSSLHPQIVALGAQVELDFTACPTLPFVRAQLQSVLFNLLSNALKYAVPGRPPRVRISSGLDPTDQHPCLTVQDNGLGIDLPRHGGQLFQLFSRFHSHVEGSGMGLYLVNRVVTSHGGRIEVASQVDEGTTFTIHLPAPPAE